MRLDTADNAYLAAGNMSQMGVTKVRSTGASDWTALVPFGYAVGLAFGQGQSVFVVGGTTARIDQAVPPPPGTDTDLSITLTDSPDPIRGRVNGTVTATVANAGPAAASAVVLRVTLPSALTFVSVVASPGLTCSGSTTITCTLASLGIGGSASATIAVRPRAVGTFNTTATVQGAETDPVLANNSDTEATTVSRR
jgi:uncharacterized repeat protein (TIGR01451 family)